MVDIADYIKGVTDMIELSNQFERTITKEVADACIKIGNLDCRLSEEEYERLLKRVLLRRADWESTIGV